MNLKISSRRSGDVTILDLEGRITIGRDNDSLSSHLQDLAHRDAKKVLVNLAQVTQLDSSGLVTLVRAYTTFQRAGGALKLLRPAGHVREVLDLTRLTKTIPTLDEEAHAVASFAASPSRPAGT